MSQSALITHADNELGKTIATAFAQKGIKMIITGSDDEYINDLGNEISELGGEVIALVTDWSKTDEIQKIQEIAQLNFGDLDLVVHLPYSQTPFQPHEFLQATQNHLSELKRLCVAMRHHIGTTLVCLNFVRSFDNSLFDSAQKNVEAEIASYQEKYKDLEFLNIDIKLESWSKEQFEALIDSIFYVIESPENVKIKDVKIIIA